MFEEEAKPESLRPQKVEKESSEEDVAFPWNEKTKKTWEVLKIKGNEECPASIRETARLTAAAASSELKGLLTKTAHPARQLVF